MSIFKALEEQYLFNKLMEAKDDATLDEKIKEWKLMKKKAAVIAKLSSTISSRVDALEADFSEIMHEMKTNQLIVDNAILEFGTKKGKTGIKYKEAFETALEISTEAQAKVLIEFLKSVTTPAKDSEELKIVDPDLVAYLATIKGIDGEDMLDKIGSIEKMPKQIMKKKIEEGILDVAGKALKSVVSMFKRAFKKVHKALVSSKKAANNLLKIANTAPVLEAEAIARDTQIHEDKKEESDSMVTSVIKRNIRKTETHGGPVNVSIGPKGKRVSVKTGDDAITISYSDTAGQWKVVKTKGAAEEAVDGETTLDDKAAAEIISNIFNSVKGPKAKKDGAEEKPTKKQVKESIGEGKTLDELTAMGGKPLSSFDDIIKIPSDGSFWRKKGEAYICFSS